MTQLNLKPSPVRKEVEEERKREEKLEDASSGIAIVGHALGFGLFCEIAETGNVQGGSNGRPLNDEQGINIDPRARLDPSKAFMPR